MLDFIKYSLAVLSVVYATSAAYAAVNRDFLQAIWLILVALWLVQVMGYFKK